jgi:Domain of unknown function (DUF4157)
MSEFAGKENWAQKNDSSEIAGARKTRPAPGVGTHANAILQLQRTIGNRAVLRILQSQEREDDAERNVSQESGPREAASRGIAGPAERLPHLEAIQKSFGRHDVSGVVAHAGEQAGDANQELNAVGYTVGNHVAFAGPPDLHTAAHEAAHVVQQQGGLHLKDGVGQAGDAYERHADAVANLVVNGQQAETLLDQMAGRGASATADVMPSADQPVQMQGAQKETQPKQTTPWLFPPVLDQKKFEEWDLMHKIKQSIADKLAHEYLNRKHPEPKDPEPKASVEGKQTPYEYKWEPGSTAPVTTGLTVNTYTGGNIPVPVQEPDEQRVSLAIYRTLDKIKTGKGDKLSDWTQKEAPDGGDKTLEEKGTEIGKWGAKQAATYAGEQIADKKLKNLAIRKGVKISIELIGDSVLGAVAVASGAGEIIGLLLLAWDVGELLYSLGEPAELKGWQAEDARIVADVKAYLQGKEDAADFKKRLLQPSQIPIRNPIDKTAVVIPHR